MPVPHTDETAQDSEDEAALPSTVSGVPGSGASTSVAKSGTVVNIAAASTPTEGDPEPQPWNVDSHSNAR